MIYMLRAMSLQTSHEKRVAGRRKEGESKRTNQGGNHSHMTAQRFFQDSEDTRHRGICGQVLRSNQAKLMPTT